MTEGKTNVLIEKNNSRLYAHVAKYSVAMETFLFHNKTKVDSAHTIDVTVIAFSKAEMHVVAPGLTTYTR